MVTPEQLRLLANEWRNFAEHARRLHTQQLELDIGGAVNSMLVVEHASAHATMLEERAAHLEMTIARGRGRSALGRRSASTSW
jgi:hypothetical protein